MKDKRGFIPLEAIIWKVKNKKKEPLAGFTLIELLVVISIIGLVSTVFIINFREGGKQLALQRSAHVLAQDLRIAKGMAMSAKKISGISGFKGSYGIRIESNGTSYILFNDLNNNQSYDIGEKIEPSILLEEEVIITSMYLNGVETSPVDIVFIPPDPATLINNNTLITTSTIVLGINSFTITVTTNNAGLIAVQ